jgi:putative resolvase
LARVQGIHAQTACCWYREGTLPVRAQKAGRLILVSPQTAAGVTRETGGAGLYARVSLHDQNSGLVGQVARLPAWAVKAGLPVVRVEAELVEAALAAHQRGLVVPGGCEVTGGLVGEVVQVATCLCAGLYGRRPARNPALKGLACAHPASGAGL